MTISRIRQRYPGPLPFGLFLDVTLDTYDVQRWYGGAYLPMVENIDYEIVGAQIKILTAISDEGELLILELLEDLTDIDKIIEATREKPAGFVPLGEEYLNSGTKYANQIRHGIGDFAGTVAPSQTPSKEGAIFKVSDTGEQNFNDVTDVIDKDWSPSISVSSEVNKIRMTDTNVQSYPSITSVKPVNKMKIYSTTKLKVRQENTRPKSIGLGYRRQVADSRGLVHIRRTFPLVSGYVPYIHIVLDEPITIRRNGDLIYGVKNLRPFDRVVDSDRSNYVTGSTLAINIRLRLRLWVIDDAVGPNMKYTFNSTDNNITINSSGELLPYREWSMERSFLDYVLPSAYKQQSVVIRLLWEDVKYNVTLSNVLRLYNTRSDDWGFYQGFYHSEYFKTSTVADIFVFYMKMVT